MKQDIRGQKAELCEVKAIHENIVTEVTQRMPNQEHVQSLAALFKVFGDVHDFQFYGLYLNPRCVFAIYVHY
jgi:hypothetical protein